MSSDQTSQHGGSWLELDTEKVSVRNLAMSGNRIDLVAGTIDIGRSPREDATDPCISIFDPTVSRRHCRLHVSPDGTELEDVGSTGGIAVNGERCRRRRLVEGDVIEVGSRRLVFHAATAALHDDEREAGELLTTQVDLGALLTVLGQNLYSTPLVVIRELVQNAHDSISRRHLESTGSDMPAPKISVAYDGKRGVLTVKDTGAGLTQHEIRAYLATVGAGYTRRLRAATADESLIGQFGLGFLSALVAGDRVTVTTTSFQQPDKGWRYVSRGGQSFTVDAIAARPVGTEVTVELKPSFMALLSQTTLEDCLRKYCSLLPYPVYIAPSTSPVNTQPPWRSGDVAADTLLEFARTFASEDEPLAAVALRVEAAAVSDGVLWVQGGSSVSDNRRMAVYVRGMLISDTYQDLLPKWARFIAGIFDSRTLTPTASREDIVTDESWGFAKAQIEKQLIDGLISMARDSPSTWATILFRHNQTLRAACVESPALFDAIGECVTFNTTEGDLDVRALRRRCGKRIYVSRVFHGGYEEVICRSLRVPIVIGNILGTTEVLSALARRLDFELVELGTNEGNRTVFATCSVTRAQNDALSELARDTDEVVFTKFEPTTLPLIRVVNRDTQLQRSIAEDERNRSMSGALRGLARGFTRYVRLEKDQLYINLDAPAIRSYLDAPSLARAGARRMLRLFADMTCGPDSMSPDAFVEAIRDFSELICSSLASGGDSAV